MTVWSIIQKSQLEGALRLDAEYYQPECLNLISKIKSQKSKFLGNFLKLLYRYPTFYNLEYYKKGVLVLKGEDITADGFIENQSQDFISEEDSRRFPKTIVKEGDLIFSVRGYVGKVGIVDKKYDGSIISANLIRAVVKDISPYFLWVYLSSNYGVKQIDRVKMITAQETIIADDIKNFLVPIIDKKRQFEIENLAQQAIQEIRKSESLYSQAEQLLLEELGLKDLDLGDELFYTVSAKETKETHRLDAEYWQSKYEKVETILSRFRQRKLKDLCSLISYGTVPTSPYVEENGVPYVKGENLQNCFINYSKLVYLEQGSTEQLPKKFYLRENDIVISQMGTVGRTGLVTKEEKGWLFASFTIRVRLKEEIKSILCPLFVTLYIQNISRPYYLLRRIAQASVRQNTDLPTIRDLKIPILPKPTQQKIALLVRQSHEARKKAKELLEEAKQKVEKMISGR